MYIMFVYCIYLEDFVYYGSTIHLRKRQALHNSRLRMGRSKAKLYEKARELGIEQLELIVLFECDNYQEVEHELILNAKNDCLNMCAVRRDRERSLRLHREAQKRYLLKIKSKN